MLTEGISRGSKDISLRVGFAASARRTGMLGNFYSPLI
jgi:hypothetical protein